MADSNTKSYVIYHNHGDASQLRLEMDAQEENVQPPTVCPKCGRTTRFGGHCECEQIFW